MAEAPDLKSVGDFDTLAPGIMVFAIMLLVTYTASTLAREAERGTLHRFRMARVSWLSLLGGVSLAQMVLASAAFALMLVAAQLMGFHNQGSYLDAYLVILVAAASTLGLGMLVASVARRRDEAANLSLLMALVMGFLSGAFFAVPEVRLIDREGFRMGLYDLLPTTHAVDALRAVMNDGATLSGVSGELAALGVLSGVYLLMGGILFRVRRMGASRSMAVAA